MKFFEAIKSLFPISRAFELFVNNNKRKMIKAFSFLPEAIRHEAELVYFDIFPDTTRFPEKWEKTFAVLFSNGEISKRRNILASLWKINNGGQSADYLEDILQSIATMKVIENVPVCNPRISLSVNIAVCGNKLMRCGNRYAICGYRLGNGDFTPSVIRNNVSDFYTLPDDERYWSACFFVCKDVLRNSNHEIVHVRKLELNIVWKNYVEYLILKIKPVHSTAIVFIEWIQEVQDD